MKNSFPRAYLHFCTRPNDELTTEGVDFYNFLMNFNPALIENLKKNYLECQNWKYY